MTLPHTYLHPHLTHRQAKIAVIGIMVLLIAVEALAALHFYVNQHDVATVAIIMTAWAKDALRSLVEHFLEG